jgi:hypothetical protein
VLSLPGGVGGQHSPSPKYVEESAMKTEYKVKCLTKQESPVEDTEINSAINAILDAREEWGFWKMQSGASGNQVPVFWVYLVFKRRTGIPV